MALRRKELKAKEMLKPKVLGRHKYEAPDIEVNLSEEIAGNMRGLKVEGKFTTLKVLFHLHMISGLF